MYKEYVQTNIKTYQSKKLEIDFAYYLSKVEGVSCLVAELQDKLSLGSFNNSSGISMLLTRPSLFSHDPKDIERVKTLHQKEKAACMDEWSLFKKKGF